MRRQFNAPLATDNEGARAYWGLYKAQVTNNNDDAKRGRLKLAIPQVTGDAEHPVWAEPVGLTMTPGSGYGGLDVQQINDWVWVEFEGGNAAYPRWRAGWWGDDELPEPFKTNYPNVRGFKTKAGHVFFVDDKDGKVHFEHADGHTVELSNNGVRVRGKDKDIVVDAGSGRVTITSSSKVVLDAPSIEVVSGASHPMLFADTFLQDLASAWTQLLSALSAGTAIGGPLVGLSAVMPTLQQFGAKVLSGQPYKSLKVKVG